MALDQIARSRRGGREARRTLRSSSQGVDDRPVRGGMEHAQQFRPLSEPDMVRIHRAALNVLETVGTGDCLPSTIEYLTGVGCELHDNGRITFPRALVEDYIPRINRDFLLAGRDPHHDMHMQGSRLYCGTAGATVSMVDPRTGAYRGTTLHDLYDCARLVDKSDNIHFFQRTVVPREIEDFYEMDINTCYASLAGTSKHVGTSWGSVSQLEDSLKMMHLIAGSEAEWRERPFCLDVLLLYGLTVEMGRRQLPVP